MRNKFGVSGILMVLILMTGCGSKPTSDRSGKDSAPADSIGLPDSVMVVDGDTIRGVTSTESNEPPAHPKSNAYIVVDKPALKLYVIEGRDTLFKGPICAGRNRGNKRAMDDGRTPEGDFRITKIHDASGWLYHANNGRWIPHVYGPWFLRLDAGGWHGIGIHGTSAPGQIGQRRSKGCIRLRNEDIKKVHDLAFVGMEVKVLPDNIALENAALRQSRQKNASEKPKQDNVENQVKAPEPNPAAEVQNETVSPENPNSTPEANPGDKPESVKPEPAIPAPVITEPVKSEPVKIDPAKAEPPKADPE